MSIAKTIKLASRRGKKVLSNTAAKFISGITARYLKKTTDITNTQVVSYELRKPTQCRLKSEQLAIKRRQPHLPDDCTLFERPLASVDELLNATLREFKSDALLEIVVHEDGRSVVMNMWHSDELSDARAVTISKQLAKWHGGARPTRTLGSLG